MQQSNVNWVKSLKDLRSAFRTHGQPQIAAGMSAYMRNQFEFFGLQTSLRRQLQYHFVRSITDVATGFDVAERLWEYAERELHYTALDMLKRLVASKSVSIPNPDILLRRCELLIQANSWWDSVDCLAPRVAGIIALRSPSVNLTALTGRWIQHPNMWIQRSALIVQLAYKDRTNAELLFSLVRAVMDSREFFLRKAAGWALREYSKTNPQAVRGFLDCNKSSLSPLTYREASKYC